MKEIIGKKSFSKATVSKKERREWPLCKYYSYFNKIDQRANKNIISFNNSVKCDIFSNRTKIAEVNTLLK